MLITLLIPYLFQKSINLQQPVFSQQRKQHCTSKTTFCRGELQSKWETNEMEENIQYWTSEFHCMNISGPLLKFRENERSMDSSNHQQTTHNRKSWTMCPLWYFTLFFVISILSHQILIPPLLITSPNVSSKSIVFKYIPSHFYTAFTL